MKKRCLAVFLALALCAGLCAPAFAASSQLEGYAKNPQYKLIINQPGKYGITYKADTYQIREISNFHWSVNADRPDEWRDWAYVYDDVIRTISPEQIPAGKMPLVPAGAEIVIEGFAFPDSDDDFPRDGLRIKAYSDPDGDGVYNERLVSDYSSVLPLKNSYYLPPDVESVSTYMFPGIGGGSTSDQQGESGHMNVSTSADSLCDIFGPNTILLMEILRVETDEDFENLLKNPVLYKASEAFLFLITGEESSGPAPSAPSFTDVPDWCGNAVNWAVSKGITQGTGNNEFSTMRTCTHGEILTFLWRAAGQQPAKAKAPVTVVSYFQDAVDWAYGEGLIGASFDAMADCTRADAVRYIWQAFGKHSAPASSFSDVPAGADYAPAVNWAVDIGVTAGTAGSTDDGTVFSPAKTCTRGEIVTFLHRAYVPEARLT